MTAPDVVAEMTGFAAELRRAGVAADRARLSTSVQALARLDPLDVRQVYWATRLSFCSEPDDLAKFDAVFDTWFGGRTRRPPVLVRPPTPAAVAARPLLGDGRGAESDAADSDALATAASDFERLRHRDIVSLDDAERDEVERLISLLAPRVGRRKAHRWRPRGREAIDVRRTVRRMIRAGGDPALLAYRRRRDKPRRLVLLIDVSGSMSPYADALLRFGHAAMRVAPASTEVFTLGTRLTRVTRELRQRDPVAALGSAAQTIADWSGGTRLGESLQAFLDRWGQRGTARRAVVVIASDGWERGDATLLGSQLARLRRLAHTVVWVNPHKGKDGFAPLTGGMLAAMPHIDELVAGHSYEALHRLAEVIAHA